MKSRNCLYDPYTGSPALVAITNSWNDSIYSVNTTKRYMDFYDVGASEEATFEALDEGDLYGIELFPHIYPGDLSNLYIGTLGVFSNGTNLTTALGSELIVNVGSNKYLATVVPIGINSSGISANGAHQHAVVPEVGGGIVAQRVSVLHLIAVPVVHGHFHHGLPWGPGIESG